MYVITRGYGSCIINGLHQVNVFATAEGALRFLAGMVDDGHDMTGYEVHAVNLVGA